MALQPVRPIAVFSLLVIGSSLAANPPSESTTPTMAIHLHNGTVIKHVTLEGPIDIETRYGKITLQPSDIRRIDFGFRVPPEDAARLNKALKELTGTNFQERETATQDLIALGRVAYPALVKMSKAKEDLETTRRVEMVLEEIRKKIPGDQLKFNEEDVVQAGDASLRGKINVDSLKVKAKILNELTVPLAHVAKLRSMSGSQFIALRPANDQPWIQTELQLTPGAAFEIKVSGTIHFDVRGSKISTGPVGSRDLSNLINRNVRQNVNIPVGLVQGRVGSEGSLFEVGKAYQGVATAEGRLYLRIFTGGPHDFPLTGIFQAEVEGN
jgi:hypothetical protein